MQSEAPGLYLPASPLGTALYQLPQCRHASGDRNAARRRHAAKLNHIISRGSNVRQVMIVRLSRCGSRRELNNVVRSNCLILSVLHSPNERQLAQELSTPAGAARFLNIRRIDLVEVQQLPSASSARFRTKSSYDGAQQHAYRAARSSGAVFVEGDQPGSVRTAKHQAKAAALAQLRPLCFKAEIKGSFVRYQRTAAGEAAHVKYADKAAVAAAKRQLQQQAQQQQIQQQQRQSGQNRLPRPTPLPQTSRQQLPVRPPPQQPGQDRLPLPAPLLPPAGQQPQQQQQPPVPRHKRPLSR